MALTKEQENKFDEVLRDAMKKQFYRGMSVGAQSICKVVLDLLTDSSLPLMKRIDTVKSYCNRSLKNGKLMFGNNQETPAAPVEDNSKVQSLVEPTQEETNNE